MSESGWGQTVFNDSQWPIVKEAVEGVRRKMEDPNMTKSSALTLLCHYFNMGWLEQGMP